MGKKTKIRPNISMIGIFIAVFLVLFSFAPKAYAAACLSLSSGNWNNAATWTTCGGTFPGPADTVTIANTHTITVTAAASATSIAFTVNGTGGVVVNSGQTLNVSGDVTAPGLKTTGAYTIAGTGTMNCTNLNVNNSTAPTGNPGNTVTLTSTIATLNISGNLVLTSTFTSGGSKTNDPIFDLQSGTVTVSGTVQTVNSNAANISTLKMNAGVQTGTLILSGATPWTLSGTGTNTILLNGTGSSVNYNYAGAQTMLGGVTYRNLLLSSTGTKSITTGATVSGNWSTATGVIANVSNGLNIPVNSLDLGGVRQPPGTWGSTSSSATYQNNTYFSSTTGILTIATGSPIVSSVAIQSLTKINLTFSQAMGTGATTSANYAVTGSGVGTATSNPNTVVLVSGNTYALNWSSGALANAAAVKVTVINAQNASGNPVVSPYNTGTVTIRPIFYFGTIFKLVLAGIKQHFVFH